MVPDISAAVHVTCFHENKKLLLRRFVHILRTDAQLRVVTPNPPVRPVALKGVLTYLHKPSLRPQVKVSLSKRDKSGPMGSVNGAVAIQLAASRALSWSTAIG